MSKFTAKMHYLGTAYEKARFPAIYIDDLRQSAGATAISFPG
jgi:hypothetical protein